MKDLEQQLRDELAGTDTTPPTVATAALARLGGRERRRRRIAATAGVTAAAVVVAGLGAVGLSSIDRERSVQDPTAPPADEQTTDQDQAEDSNSSSFAPTIPVWSGGKLRIDDFAPTPMARPEQMVMTAFTTLIETGGDVLVSYDTFEPVRIPATGAIGGVTVSVGAGNLVAWTERLEDRVQLTVWDFTDGRGGSSGDARVLGKVDLPLPAEGDLVPVNVTAQQVVLGGATAEDSYRWRIGDAEAQPIDVPTALTQASRPGQVSWPTGDGTTTVATLDARGRATAVGEVPGENGVWADQRTYAAPLEDAGAPAGAEVTTGVGTATQSSAAIPSPDLDPAGWSFFLWVNPATALLVHEGEDGIDRAAYCDADGSDCELLDDGPVGDLFIPTAGSVLVPQGS